MHSFIIEAENDDKEIGWRVYQSWQGFLLCVNQNLFLSKEQSAQVQKAMEKDDCISFPNLLAKCMENSISRAFHRGSGIDDSHKKTSENGVKLPI